MYTHRSATYEVTAINHVTMGTVHIFDICHWTNMVATLHKYVPLPYFYNASIESHISTLINQIFCLCYSYKVMGINMAKKIWLPNVM